MRQIFWLSILCIIETIYGLCVNKGCTFNGMAYAPNSQVEFGCFVFTCIQNQVAAGIPDMWQFSSINGNCPTCWVRNDPHFYTFDSHYFYDFHGLCNYTISQPVECCDVFSSYFPTYGIFGDFKVCVHGLPNSKCLDVTTYKISEDLWIEIKDTSPTPTLKINGEPLTVFPIPVSYYGCSSSSSVIIFKSGNCIYIVGTHYSIVACYEFLIIYTVPEHKNKIAGLCGFYSGTNTDEYRLRDCSYEDVGNEIPFGENWKTIDQSDKECKECPSISTIPVEVLSCPDEEAKEICEDRIYEAHEKCPLGHTEFDVTRVIEDCINDCCSTGIEENCQRWANVGFEFLCTLSNLTRVTKGSPIQE